jgi:putative membrane protein
MHSEPDGGYSRDIDDRREAIRHQNKESAMTYTLHPRAGVHGPRAWGKLRRVMGATALCVAGVALAVNVHADTVPGKDKSFMIKAAEAGNAEVAASKAALEKSTNPAVKDFAQKMIAQHTQVGDELKQLASSKDVSLPSEPTVAQRAKIAVLDKLSGHTFDKRYASMIGVSAHQDAVKLFQKASTSAQDPDVKNFAAKTLPGLQEHLQMATELKSKVDAAKE